jgi:uncharacterized membrane protein YfcA
MRERRIAFREAVFMLCTAAGAWLGVWITLPLDASPEKHDSVSGQVSHAMITVLGPTLAGAVIGAAVGYLLARTLPGLRSPR